MRAKKILYVLVALCFIALSGTLFSACGKEAKLRLVFESNGGTPCSTIEVKKGDTLSMPEDPNKEAYLFGGWFEDNAFVSEFDAAKIDSYMSQKELTLYAKWVRKVNLVFMRLDEPIADVYLDSLDKQLPTPQKEGYIFGGWYLDNGTFVNAYTTSTLVTPNEYNEVYLYPRWKVDSSNPKTVYYFADDVKLDKMQDQLEPESKLSLYLPSVPYYEFCGWFYDRQLTRQAPMRLSNDMVDEEYITLYGKFVPKEIESVNILGQPKIYYEYGESLDLNGAKLLVIYKDEKYPDEVVDITEDMVSYFSTEQNSNYVSFVHLGGEGNSEAAAYDFSGSFSVRALDSKGNTLASTYVDYYVKSDLESFSIDKESFTFDFGDDISLASKDVVVNWKKKSGESGSEKLVDGSGNYRVGGLRTDFVGTSTFKLYYHYKAIEVSYTVNPVEISSGYIDESNDLIFLNSGKTLLDCDIVLVLATGYKYVTYGGLKQEDIIEDIDSSTIGNHKAKIMFNGKEIEIDYFVVDVSKIVSAEIMDGYYLNGSAYNFIVTFTMEDGTTFTYSFSRFVVVGEQNTKILTGIDTSTTGEKYARVYFYGREFDVKYYVW